MNRISRLLATFALRKSSVGTSAKPRPAPRARPQPRLMRAVTCRAQPSTLKPIVATATAPLVAPVRGRSQAPECYFGDNFSCCFPCFWSTHDITQ